MKYNKKGAKKAPFKFFKKLPATRPAVVPGLQISF